MVTHVLDMTGRVIEGTGSLWATDEDVAIKAPNVMTDKSRETTQKVMHSSGDTGLLYFGVSCLCLFPGVCLPV